jgi:anti-sigma factor (TIGR02949 family)
MPERSLCESVVRQLWPYLDGRVDESERERIVGHLENCERCSSHMDFARAFVEAVSAFGPRATVTDALQTRVMAALVREGFGAHGQTG